MSYCYTLYYETLRDVEKCKVLLPLFESTNPGKFKQVKDKLEEYYESLPNNVKETLDSLSFDTNIMKTFGFGITSLINPVLTFLNSQKVEATPQEVVLLVLGIAFSFLKEPPSSLKEPINNVNEDLKSLRFYNKVKTLLSVFKRYGLASLVKFLEYLGYTSLAIPGAGAVLTALSGNAPDFKQLLGGVGLSAASHLVRSFLKSKTTS